MLTAKTNCPNTRRFHDSLHIERVSQNEFKLWGVKEDGTHLAFDTLGSKTIWVGENCTLIINGIELNSPHLI